MAILWGRASIKGNTMADDIGNASTIIMFKASDKSGFTPGKDYYISTLPCDLYGGYRLSFYKDGLVADYFGVHQTRRIGNIYKSGRLGGERVEI